MQPNNLVWLVCSGMALVHDFARIRASINLYQPRLEMTVIVCALFDRPPALRGNCSVILSINFTFWSCCKCTYRPTPWFHALTIIWRGSCVFFVALRQVCFRKWSGAVPGTASSSSHPWWWNLLCPFPLLNPLDETTSSLSDFSLTPPANRTCGSNLTVIF